MKRECIEEIGCNIKSVKSLGYTEEYWKEDEEKQISYCYVAELDGNKGTLELTQSEKDREFQTLWVTIEEAIASLESCVPSQWEEDYIPQRELFFFVRVSNLWYSIKKF